jgi:N4-gp56 family major capsid protein
MSDWEFATGNALTRKAWHKKWWSVAKTESFFYDNGLVGADPNNAIIVEMADLEKDQGDVITYGQIRELSGAGVSGDSAMEDNEESPDTYDDSITIGQIRNAIRSGGALNMQRPSDNGYRAWARDLLARWKAATLDQAIFTALGTSSTKAIYGGDATATNNIEAGDYMTLYMISRMVAYARKATPRIVGPQYKGMKTNGVVVIGPDQAFDLQQRDAAWSDSRMNAALRGKTNPMFTGALGMHDMCPIHQHVRCPTSAVWGSGANLNGGTGFFLGVGSGAIAYTKRWIWNEKTFDYGNKVGFCIGLQYGVSKSVFNSADNAVGEFRTYRTSN